MEPLKEKAIQNQILHWLRIKGLYAWHTKTTATFDKRQKRFLKVSALYRLGVSDIIGLLPGGRLFAIEVKSKKGRLQPNQSLFQQEVNDLGGLAFTARSVEDVEKMLGGIKR